MDTAASTAEEGWTICFASGLVGKAEDAARKDQLIGQEIWTGQK